MERMEPRGPPEALGTLAPQGCLAKLPTLEPQGLRAALGRLGQLGALGSREAQELLDPQASQATQDQPVLREIQEAQEPQAALGLLERLGPQDLAFKDLPGPRDRQEGPAFKGQLDIPAGRVSQERLEPQEQLEVKEPPGLQA
jgi:hypothetical protein